MLKNILSLLLSKFYSKQESELVGHQAMPSTNNVILTPTTTVIDGWSSVFNGVAPTDGFACIRFTADTATCIASAQTTNINVFTTPQVVGDILLCACPVAKGQVFTLCARQAKNIECWFTKTIGGGYRLLSLQWPHLILPCAKGDSWQVVISTKIGQTEGTVIGFIPSIGG